MAKCVMEMQERMHDIVNFTQKDLQALLALDLALGSKLRAMPKAVVELVPQVKKKDQSPMCWRGEKKLKVVSTASTNEGTTTLTPPKNTGCEATPKVQGQARRLQVVTPD